MRVQLKKATFTLVLIKALKQAYHCEEDAEKITFSSEKEIILPREWSGLGRTAFRELCKSLKVKQGIKYCLADEILLKPKREEILKIRVSTQEHETLRKAAEQAHQPLAEFVRDSALRNAERLIRRKK